MISENSISPLGPQDAARFRDVCRAADYTETRIHETIEWIVPPPRGRVGSALAESITADATALTVLTSLFFLGMPLPAAIADQVLPSAFVRICLECGLLVKDEQRLRPTALVVPVGDAWLASDLQLIESQEDDRFVPPVCDAALHLGALAIREPVGKTLDLCSGFALHGILSSPFSEQVVTTDLNPRAAIFSVFNAALNGCDNVTALTGDLFEPVRGERFDRILSNPPFIISPEAVRTFRYSSYELDGFVRRLLTEAPEFLTENGVMQIVCEWVELQGQSWQDRLAGWLRGNGCDVWILPANRQLPASYARSVLGQTIDDEAELQSRQKQWEQYFLGQRVEAIHGGFLLLRRRQGNNWFDVTELTKPIRHPVGDAITQGFASRDLIFREDGDESVLGCRPHVADGLRQVETAHWKSFRWQVDSIVLHLDQGLPLTIGIDEYVRCLIEKFDGARTVASGLDLFSEEVGLPAEMGRKQGLQIVRSMIKNGILVVAT